MGGVLWHFLSLVWLDTKYILVFQVDNNNLKGSVSKSLKICNNEKDELDASTTCNTHDTNFDVNALDYGT